MKLAERINNIGTETAFAVSGEAAAIKAKGVKVYPFHLGDLNIPTPQNIVDAANRAIKEGKTGYCPAAGIPELREALANDINKSHKTNFKMENAVIQPGGKPVITKFIQSIMNPGDEVIYPNPGYPIYESQIEYFGGKAVPYGYRQGAKTFELDLDRIESLVTPKTKAIIINDLNNPTSAEASPEERKRLAEIVVKNNLWALLDEAYFDMRFGGVTTSLIEEPGMLERSVILYTFSKKFAMTGWRLGGAIGPADLIASIAMLNTNDESCSSHFIQWAGVEGLTGDQSQIKKNLELLKKRRDKGVEMLNSIEGVTCLKPEATFYLFPNFTEAMKKKGMPDYETFRKAALAETGVAFCTRKHFGRPLPEEDQLYLRFAFSGIDIDQIEEGLSKLKKWVEN